MIKVGICADNKVAERLKKYLLEGQYRVDEIRLSIYQDADEMPGLFDDKEDFPNLIFCDITESSETLKNIRKRNALTYFENEKFKDALQNDNISCLITTPKYAGVIPSQIRGVVLTENPKAIRLYVRRTR